MGLGMVGFCLLLAYGFSVNTFLPFNPNINPIFFSTLILDDINAGYEYAAMIWLFFNLQIKTIFGLLSI